MSVRLLEGKQVRDQILAELRPRIAALPRPPGLAVVLVGNDPASEIYVRNKVKTCAELGIFSQNLTPPASITTAELLMLVGELNERLDIDGILVQSPLPKHIEEGRVLEAISPKKDVDGFHPINAGKLSINAKGLRPCTPSGVMEMLKRNNIDVTGKHAVVVGRSDIVGKPMALMLLHANATVTICHSKTRDLAAMCRQADILVGAIGRPAMLTSEFFKPGAVLIDIGINRLDKREDVVRIFRGDAKKLAAFDAGSRVVVGDFDPLDAVEFGGAFTPVPGGVGLLTIAMLMSNTVTAAEARQTGAVPCL